MDKIILRDCLILLALGLLVCGIFYSGPNLSSDDRTYIYYAQQYLNGTFQMQQSPYAYGTLFLASIAWSWKFLGSYVTAQILEYLALVLCIYLLLRKYFSEKVSLLAASFVLLSPFVFVFATRVLSDMALGLLFTLSFLFIAYGKDTKYETYSIILAGSLLGLTIFIKLGGALFLGFIVVAYWLTDGKPIHAITLIAGILIILLLYVFLLPTGLSSSQLLSQYSSNQKSISVASLPVNLATLMAITIGYWNISLGYTIFSQVFPLGGLFFMALAGLALMLYKKEKKYSIYVIAFILGFLWLFFGTESLSSYTFIVVVSRYFIWFIPELAILAAYAISWALSKNWKYALALIIVFFLLSNLLLYIFFFLFPSSLPYHLLPAINKSS